MQDYNRVYRDKGVLVMNTISCDKESCFAWTQPSRYKNCCTALEEVFSYECPFYKSKGQVKDEREAMRLRASKDKKYRLLLEDYGIKFNKRGRKSDGE